MTRSTERIRSASLRARSSRAVSWLTETVVFPTMPQAGHKVGYRIMAGHRHINGTS